MNWTTLLEIEMNTAFSVTENLMKMVDEDKLNWKPATGTNWLTTGQLLMHLTDACGAPVKGFVTGDWGFPEDVDPSQMSAEDMLPPAVKFSTVNSVGEAIALLQDDRKLVLDMLAQCDEKRLETEIATAPWDPSEMILGHRILTMVNHLNQHKGQLFYYLKLQGKPVHTGHLWGM